MDRGVSFDGFRFELISGRLWSGDREVRLTPKAADVLKVLVTRAGTPVSKDELFATVWSGTSVSDDALTSCIQELRRSLADDSKQPRFIETRHRRGYQFIAPLTEAAAAAEPDPAESPDLSAIAVLPFADMSADRDQDYLCDGLAEEIINALTHIDGLRVVARTASFQYRAAGADVREIGRQLGVGTLLEGSVRKADNRLRVTVQLIETATGFHRWSQRFDRALNDVFAMEDEIAESVVTSLRGGFLSGRERQALRRQQTGPEAYECYLRGRQYLPRLTRPDLEKSGEMFERAIAFDAGYGPAYAGLAIVHATLHEWFGAEADDLATAERASQRALELSADMAEAHVARGQVLSQSRKYSEAAREFEEAIRLNANLFEAYYYYARTAFASGHIAQSADLFCKAAQVQTDDFQSVALFAQSLRMLDRGDEARTATREAIRRAEHRLALNPEDGRVLSLGSGILFYDGQVDRAMAWSRRSIELYPDDSGVLLNAACLYSKMGKKEACLEVLERVFAHGWGKRDWIEHDPDYDILRDDPRFKKLIDKLT
jgi:TolB-like protein/Flp pilus assembly protein TadD